MDYDLNSLKEVGVDVDKGIEYTRSEDKYLSAIQRYYKSYSINRDKLEGFYENKDLNDYRIVAHSLKSNSRMIGLNDMADSFELLENAANNNDIDTINNNHLSVLDNYNKCINMLKPIGEMKLVKPEDEISSIEAKETATKLLEALDDFDDELSSELIHKLSGYPFRITQRKLLDKAIAYVEDFLYDDAAAIIKDLENTIE